MGFAVPISAWLRRPLKDWGEALLDRRRLKDQGLLNHDLIRGKWSEHQSGKEDWRTLWDVLMFQAWFDSQQQHVRSTEEVTCGL